MAVAVLSTVGMAGQLALSAPALRAMVAVCWARAEGGGTWTMPMHARKSELRAFLCIAKRPAQFKQRIGVGEEWHKIQKKYFCSVSRIQGCFLEQIT